MSSHNLRAIPPEIGVYERTPSAASSVETKTSRQPSYLHEYYLSPSDLLRRPGISQCDSILSSPRTSPGGTSPALSIRKLLTYTTPSGFKIHAGSSDDRGRSRIQQQFSNVDEAYINHLMRMYNNRENLVISALLAEGHSRNKVLLDESLFYKFKSVFPNVESEVIRKLLIKNENKEHSTITALLGHFGLFNTARYEHWQCPQMKLKYLKFAFPDIDEIVLLDLLFNNDNNVNKVSKHLLNVGYQTSELKVKISKISETALVKEATEKLNAPRLENLTLKISHHANLEEQEIIRRQLCEKFNSVDLTLINAALEACSFDRERAESFLQAMTPQDSNKYFERTLQDREREKGEYRRVSRSMQTRDVFHDLFGTDLLIPQIENNVPREDKATWTKEDEVFVPAIQKMAIGPMQAKGSTTNKISRCIAIGSSGNAKGHDGSLNVGSRGSSERYKTRSQGPQAENKKGPIGKQIATIREKNVNLDF